MFEAAQRAYADAQVDPRADVDSFVCCSEDYLEGTSIFDEYVPDQLGAVQRPVQTVAADGLFGVVTALLLIRSGAARVVAVEAHSKVSGVLTEAPVWTLGAGWSSGSPTLESRTWGEADFVARAAERAYAMAGIEDPGQEIDLAEVDDVFAFKELQHLEALGFGTAGELAEMLAGGALEADGELPVNVSGGSLGQGNLF